MRSVFRTAAVLLLCTAGLLCFPAVCADAVRDGLSLCATRVLPALFPFFVLSSLTVSCGVADALRRPLERWMRPLFGVGGAGAGALVLGLIGGYPVGARTVAELYRRGQLDRAESERLLCFCNNAGPGFLLGVCGTAVFGDIRFGAWLYLIHVTAALLTGLLFAPHSTKHRTAHRSEVLPERRAGAVPPPQKPLSLVAALPGAVASALSGALNVCAYVVVFLVLLRLAAAPAWVTALLPAGSLRRAIVFGALELTNGVSLLGATRTDFLAAAVLVGWGGCSVHAQTLGVLAGTDLSLRCYLFAKLTQALLSLPLAVLAAAHLFA